MPDFTYDLGTDIGKIRLRILDKDANRAVFTDDELQVFLDAEGGSWLLAAALALETMATDTKYLSKRVRLPDYEVDQTTIAAGLLAQASAIRQRVAESGEAGAFDIAELVYNDFTARERLIAEALREG